ncbi:hypothetical protein GCM10010517_73040 [Streptosporangium fragile]|uniref:Pr1-like protein n=1 Tax=Streptosporangium fragile TaxID=46186 RepID=A0ABN3W9U0_9ACTN
MGAGRRGARDGTPPDGGAERNREEGRGGEGWKRDEGEKSEGAPAGRGRWGCLLGKAEGELETVQRVGAGAGAFVGEGGDDIGDE